MHASRSCCRVRQIASLPFRRLLSTTPVPAAQDLVKSRGEPIWSNLKGSNPELAKYYKKVSDQKHAEQRKKDAEESGEVLALADQERGGLADNSILHEPIAQDSVAGSATYLYGHAIPRERLMALDPTPHRRRRWERKKVIQEIRNRGRVPRAIQIKRSERDIRMRSPFMHTSVKKLSPLANQIAGKTIDEAILQMRFSKKKAAIAIRQYLELARDRAVAQYGFGLGRVHGTMGEKIKIRLKDGSPHQIFDRTAIYIDQAWVNRGKYGLDGNKRSHGRVDVLRLPQTRITLVLKEEATRIREFHEREEKEAARKPWIQMPDRPITTQRPYYTW